jgi:hypothetical protein
MLSKGRKQALRGMTLVWQAVLWALWRSRNDRIFLDKVVELDEIVDRIKFFSWKWLLAKNVSSPCLLYE